MWGNLWRDVGFAVRMLRRHPGFTFVSVATLAIGLGANAAIFTVVNAVLLRPLPYAAQDRLFVIDGLSYTGEFLELERRARTFDVASYNVRQATLTGDGDPVRLPAAAVSVDLVTLLGAAPIAGRPFTPGDEQSADGVVVLIAYDLWRGRFAGDAAIVGRRITVDGVTRTIVGVMPPLFAFPAVETQLWIPSTVDVSDRIGLWSTSRRMIGRLRTGFGLADADAELKTMAPSMRALFPWSMPADYGRTAAAVPLRESLVANVRPLLMLLFASVGVVLLIACVNVSHLLLARTLARRRELAIRASLGAARARLMAHVLIEGVVLVAAGVAIGLSLGLVAARFLSAWLPADLPRPVSFAIDARMLGFAGFITGIAVLFIAVLPALRASRLELAPQLVDGQRTGFSRRSRWTANILVAAQMTCAVVLVVSAVLLVRSLRNLTAVSTGFTVDQVLSARISPPAHRYPTIPARRELYATLLDRAASIRGVEAVAVTNRLPFSGEAFGSVFMIEGRPNPATTGEWPIADISAIVSPRFFDVLGIDLREGRGFSEQDSASAMRVTIVSETLARRYWPGESPLGRRFAFPGDRDGLRTIVGVVADVKWERMTDEPKGALYIPVEQGAPGPMRLVLRTNGAAATTFAHVRSVVQGVDREMPVDQMRPIADWVAASVGQPRFAASMLAGFAAVSLLLGAMGVYGTISDHVAQRRREIGVRVALGAQRVDVIRAVAGGTFMVVALGAGLGVLLAAAVTRAFATLLYGIAPTDSATFVTAVLILGATALAAAFAPARRAATVDPITALRD